MAEKTKTGPRADSGSDGTTPPLPTVTIYQNPDYVSGILQQLYRQPLVKGNTLEEGGSHERSENRSVEGSGQIKGSVGWFGSGAEVAGKLAAAAGSADKDSTSGKRTSVWEYTQATIFTSFANHCVTSACCIQSPACPKPKTSR
ncbi:hypothetical protein NtRootA1_30990 [Arthrobacter sp. NtRootA1]|nr:hypothetical protein NtRootA1_30990 [Arthrobacter sp. NtRootA1]